MLQGYQAPCSFTSNFVDGASEQVEGFRVDPVEEGWQKEVERKQYTVPGSSISSIDQVNNGGFRGWRRERDGRMKWRYVEGRGGKMIISSSFYSILFLLQRRRLEDNKESVEKKKSPLLLDPTTDRAATI